MRRLFSIIEAGKRLRIELPFLRESRAEFFSALSLPDQPLGFTVHLGETPIASGTVESEGRFECSLAGRPHAAYSVRIMAALPDEREIWKQLVYAQPSVARTPEQVDALARRHAPVLLFSHKEDYFPVSLQDLLEAPELIASNQFVRVRTIFGTEDVPLSALSEFLRFNGHSDYLLDQSLLSLSHSDFKKIHGSASTSVVYYSYIEDADGETFYINYHTFYAFDPKTGIAKLLNIGPHIFDRESLTIAFNRDAQPISVVLSGHLENQTISFFNKLIAWSSGRVAYPANHPRAPHIGGHPIVPVAEGSHALYPAAGRYRISVLTELAGHIMRQFLPEEGDDDEPAELHNKQVLLPPDLRSTSYANYDLRPLRLDRLVSAPADAGPLFDPATAALVFSGFWVDVPGPQNARFPPFSKKEREIGTWVSNAFEWQWDSLPDDVLGHNQGLTAAIAARVEQTD